ncbi:UDP-4-amino-4,6-dideoxy-N-acetyl-beta-L-altrosamine transaminase [Pseudodesulfovibrio cashew]|uniref:UDP-4-amino-4, 6-dideoxy-N-acetyl-beta-L-altrosamine transaminase n=1 Tax=Pseudodesulfovibrio cashew TaxID=2678688 RepID=A0A6I6JAX7_9BACT|nr:DegT/DnrJ/EryC1/StrS family aminotransferase [Pseudodesulfovibrio cashew]QGY39875.1 UDP-4-amino-4,6-dideoxy-N-acetyl-beta-L-altrosamine transaminase [Pseudodesulfovibrio cashew]
MPVRTKDNFLVFGAPLIEQDEIDEVAASMRSGWLGTGPKVARFESDFAAYLGGGYAAACNSCTAALHLSLVALGLKPGDEVITTPLTFCASVNAIIHAGCTPVLADVDPVTMNIDPDRIREKITDRTRAILPVHFAGRACDMDPIMAIAREHGLKVVEDCAHAIETTYKGQHAGTFGDFGCFSFYVTKNVCTGEGGMVIAREEEDIRNVKVLGLHGMSADAWKRFSDDGYKHYQVIHAGFKYNMMDIQAAIGIHQLKRVEQCFVRRCEIWDRYQEAFRTLPVGQPAPEEPGTRHARHLYTLLIDPVPCGIDRDEFLMRMNRENIGCGVHYLAVPEHPYYQERFGWKLEDTPHAVAIGRQTISLPLSPKLTDEDVEDVITAVKTCLAD